MGPRPAHADAGTDGNRHHVSRTAPPASWRQWAGTLVLAATAGVAVLPGAMTGTPSARAAAAVPAQVAASAHSQPEFGPCPCTSPLCKNGCSQS